VEFVEVAGDGGELDELGSIGLPDAVIDGEAADRCGGIGVWFHDNGGGDRRVEDRATSGSVVFEGQGDRCAGGEDLVVVMAVSVTLPAGSVTERVISESPDCQGL
jgi:hypothetical protein